MGILRKQPKQGKATDWVSPAQMAPPVSPEPAGPTGQPYLGGLPDDVPPVPTRFRAMTPAGSFDWLNGALLLSPGSVLWQPDPGVSAAAVEFATATMVPVTDIGNVGNIGNIGKRRPGYQSIFVEVETPTGRYQLEIDPESFEICQQLAAEAAASKDQLGGL